MIRKTIPLLSLFGLLAILSTVTLFGHSSAGHGSNTVIAKRIDGPAKLKVKKCRTVGSYPIVPFLETEVDASFPSTMFWLSSGGGDAYIFGEDSEKKVWDSP